MKERYDITIRGTRDRWSFRVDGTPKDAAEWFADGLDVVKIAGTSPVWLPSWATRLWRFAERCFYFRNPFAG